VQAFDARMQNFSIQKTGNGNTIEVRSGAGYGYLFPNYFAIFSAIGSPVLFSLVASGLSSEHCSAVGRSASWSLCAENTDPDLYLSKSWIWQHLVRCALDRHAPRLFRRRKRNISTTTGGDI